MLSIILILYFCIINNKKKLYLSFQFNTYNMKNYLLFLLLLICTISKLAAQDSLYTVLHQQYDKVGCFNDEGLAIIGKSAKMGIIDKSGKILIPFIYDYITEIQDKYLEVGNNNKKGIIDINNTLILPIEFEAIGYYKEDTFIVKKNNLYGMIDNKQRWILPCEYSVISIYENGNIAVSKEGLVGLLNKELTWIVPLFYNKLTLLNGYELNCNTFFLCMTNSSYLSIEKNKKKGILDNLGNIIIPCEYDKISNNPVNNTWIVQTQKGYGLIDNTGKIISPCQYKKIIYHEEHAYFIATDSINKYGIIDNKNQIIEPFIYDNIKFIDSSYYVVQKDSLVLTPKIAIKEMPIVEDNAININSCTPTQDTTHFYIRAYQRYYILNIQNHSLSEQYDDLSIESINSKMIIIAEKKEKVGVLLPNANILIPFLYDKISVYNNDTDDMHEEYFELIQKKLYGVANDKGKIIVDYQYEEIDLITNQGHLSLMKNNQYFLADLAQGLLSNQSFDEINSPYDIENKKEYYFIVSKHHKYGILSASNKYIMPIKYDNINYFGTNYLYIENHEKQALFTLEGKQITPFIYDNIKEIYPLYNNSVLFIASINHKKGIIDSLGNILIPFLYETLTLIEKERDSLVYIEAYLQETDSIPFYFDIKGNSINKPFFPNYVSFEKNGSCGYTNEKEKIIISYQYNFPFLKDDAYFNEKGFIILSTFEQEAIINTRNEIIVPFIYNTIEFDKKNILVTQYNKSGILDTKGNIILPVIYDKIEKVNNFYQITKDNKQALINQNGKFIVPLIYYRIEKTTNNMYIVTKQGDAKIIDSTGKALTNFHFNLINSINNYIFSGYNNKKFIHFTIDGKILFKTKSPNNIYFDGYKDVIYTIQHNNLLVYNDKGKFLGKNICIKENIIYNQYYIAVSTKEYINTFKEDNYNSVFYDLTYIEGKYGLIDSLGNIIIPFIYDNISKNDDGYVLAILSDKKYLFDKNGKSIIPQEYTAHNHFSDGLIAVSIDNKWGFMNQNEKLVINMEYDLVSDFDENKAVVYKNEKCGIIDTSGKMIVPIIYEGLEIYHNSYIKVKADCKFGFLNDKGNVIIPIIYDFIEKRELIYIEMNDSLEIKNKQKEMNRYHLFPKNLNSYKEEYFYDYYIVMQNGLFGLIDTLGKELIPCKYNSLEMVSNNILKAVNIDNQILIINRQDSSLFAENINQFSRVYNYIWIIEDKKKHIYICDVKEERIFQVDDLYIENLNEYMLKSQKENKPLIYYKENNNDISLCD